MDEQSTIAVLTSGGDAPGMNAATVAVVKTAAAAGWKVLGVEDGYDGLIEARWTGLSTMNVDDVSREGGTFLRSARSSRFRTQEGRKQAATNLRQAGCEVFSGDRWKWLLTGAKIFGEESGVRVVGIPASIDNDIACTSMCIGVDSAVNSIVEACAIGFPTLQDLTGVLSLLKLWDENVVIWLWLQGLQRLQMLYCLRNREKSKPNWWMNSKM